MKISEWLKIGNKRCKCEKVNLIYFKKIIKKRINIKELLLIILVLLLSCGINKKGLFKIKYRLRVWTKVRYMPILKTYWVETILVMDRYLDSEIIKTWSDTIKEKRKIRSVLKKQKKELNKSYKVWSDIIKNDPNWLDKAWKKWKSKRTVEITDY